MLSTPAWNFPAMRGSKLSRQPRRAQTRAQGWIEPPLPTQACATTQAMAATAASALRERGRGDKPQWDETLRSGAHASFPPPPPHTYTGLDVRVAFVDADGYEDGDYTADGYNAMDKENGSDNGSRIAALESRIADLKATRHSFEQQRHVAVSGGGGGVESNDADAESLPLNASATATSAAALSHQLAASRREIDRLVDSGMDDGAFLSNLNQLKAKQAATLAHSARLYHTHRDDDDIDDIDNDDDDDVAEALNRMCVSSPAATATGTGDSGGGSGFGGGIDDDAAVAVAVALDEEAQWRRYQQQTNAPQRSVTVPRPFTLATERVGWATIVCYCFLFSFAR
jgi:hypothetical protein